MRFRQAAGCQATRKQDGRSDGRHRALITANAMATVANCRKPPNRGDHDRFLFNLKSDVTSVIKGIKPLNRKACRVTAGDVIAVIPSGKRSQGRCHDDTRAALQMREARRELHGDNSHGLYQRNQPHQAVDGSDIRA
jgi:hypothetical protein